MHALNNRIDARHVIAALLASMAIFAAVAAIPSGASHDGLLASVGPQTAQAFEGGYDTDHYWVKISAGDIAGGAVEVSCRRVAGPAGFLCGSVASRARDMIGSSNGVWAELYTNGTLHMGTW